MHKYEIVALADSDIDEHQVSGLIEKYLEVITASGGVVDNVDRRGHRRLVCDVNEKFEVNYTAAQVACNPASVQELDHLMGIDERIICTKVLRLEK